ALNLATVRNEIVLSSDGSAQSNGAPDQEFVLRRKPVFVPQPDDGVSGSLELSFEPPNGNAETWKRVPDFLASGRDDPHYVLDPTAGTIRTGGLPDPDTQEIRGRIP